MFHRGCIAGLALFGIFFTASFAAAQGSSPLQVSPAQAESHLAHKVEPVVPSLAKVLRVGGDVKLSFVISPKGDVSNLKVVSGHPVVAQAALEAVRQWKYEPFTVDGKAVAAATEVTIKFPGGMSVQEQQVRNKYFPVVENCSTLLNRGKYAEAEAECRRAVKLSNELPATAVLEHSEPRALLGNAIFLQDRVKESIPLYEEALKLDKGYAKPDDADLATDYENLARARAANGDLEIADQLYSTAVSTFEAAIKSLPDMKENYTRRLQRSLNEYANLKEARGDLAAAEQLKNRARHLGR